MSAGEVHLWRFSLDRPAGELRRLGQLLSPDERGRADAFHFERDRQRFVAGRGQLRLLLSRYTDVAPARLRFCYSRFGKPALTGLGGTKAPEFNLSHSEGIGICAVAEGRFVGVDVERLRTDLDVMSIARRYFSPTENAALIALPSDGQPRAFFECWTRKEAYVKAVGGGLSIPLDSFEVAVGVNDRSRLLADRRDPVAVDQWTIRSLDLGGGLAAAVAFEGGACRTVGPREFPD